jgi:prepilin-type processing-associated H-X9-DG protein
MYKIIGTDQKEYGPVTAYQINQWIVQGRVNGFTKGQAEGGEWKTLNQFPEFAEALANRPTSPPPILQKLPAGSSPSSGGNGLAVASLVLGVLGLPTCGITAIVGLILGIIAFIQTGKSNGTGRGTALAGMIVSAVFLLMLPFGAAVFLPAFAKGRSRALSIACLNNARQLDLAFQLYASSNTNLPQAATWCDSLVSFVGSTNVFQCPANRNEPCGYAFNTNLSGLNPGKVNPNTVLLFESDGGWNASGGQERLLRQSRHGRTVVVAFADGHVEAVAPERMYQLRWNP